MALTVRYLSNMGVSIEGGKHKVLIDSICTGTEANFIETISEIKKGIIMNRSPYDSIDVMLFTHKHEDHFDFKSVSDYLKYRKNQNTSLILTKGAKELFQYNEPFDNVVSVSLEKGTYDTIQVNGLNIKIYGMRHEGKIFEDIQNLAFLVEMDNKKVLHLGDAAPFSDNFDEFNFINEKIDLVIAPFLYLNMETGRKIIEDQIKPRKVLVTHLPKPENDLFGWNRVAYQKLKQMKVGITKFDIANKVNSIFYV